MGTWDSLPAHRPQQRRAATTAYIYISPAVSRVKAISAASHLAHRSCGDACAVARCDSGLRHRRAQLDRTSVRDKECFAGWWRHRTQRSSRRPRTVRASRAQNRMWRSARGHCNVGPVRFDSERPNLGCAGKRQRRGAGASNGVDSRTLANTLVLCDHLSDAACVRRRVCGPFGGGDRVSRWPRTRCRALRAPSPAGAWQPNASATGTDAIEIRPACKRGTAGEYGWVASPPTYGG
jgi:hypothetical protein